MIRLIAAAALAIAAAMPAIAADEAPAELQCHFDTGNSWSYEAGKYQSAAPAPLQFKISAINLEAQTASLVVDGKTAGALRVVRALNANHFLEVANEGFLNLTTVYDLDPVTGSYPAVHSRHFGIFGQPVFSQYAGSCSPK